MNSCSAASCKSAMGRNLGHIVPAKRQWVSLISETNIAIRFTEECMGQKYIFRNRKKPCVPETSAKSEPSGRKDSLSHGTKITSVTDC